MAVTAGLEEEKQQAKMSGYREERRRSGRHNDMAVTAGLEEEKQQAKCRDIVKRGGEEGAQRYDRDCWVEEGAVRATELHLSAWFQNK